MVIMKVETDIIISIIVGLIGPAVILVIKFVQIFKPDDVILFLSVTSYCV
jgi:hypothetical protein